MAGGTPPIPLPPSRLAAGVGRAIDVADAITRPLLLDVENVPSKGPFMLVGNHQLLGMQDLPSLVRGLERARGVRVRGMADRFHFSLPLWRSYLTRAGAVPGTRENCAALLAAGEPVLVFPGGAREVYKRRGQRYELLWGSRTGFARMAIAAGCPIVPFGAVGAEDRFDVLVDTDHLLATPVRRIVQWAAGRDDVGTVLVRGGGPAGLPRPDRLYFRFGAPIATTPWAGRESDPDALAECRDVVKAEVQAQIDALLAYRVHDPERGLLPRLAHGARSAVAHAPRLPLTGPTTPRTED
jgi:1-acyl-sn-glycerol-3-phosphate acyltransferase